jgi:hypothetical protein
MVGTRAITRWLPFCFTLQAMLAGCMPSLDELRNEAGLAMGVSGSGGSASGGGPSSSVTAGAGGSSAAGAAGGAVSAFGGAPTIGGAGMATNGGSPATCQPSGDETCNGADDDCDGVADDGCPGGASTLFEKDLPAIGDSPGGDVFKDDCADGAVLTGVNVAMGQWLSQVQGVCSKARLELSSGAPTGYAIRLLGDAELSAHPAVTKEPVTKLACPDGETLVGLRIAQQTVTGPSGGNMPAITRIWASCAKLLLDKQGDVYVVSWKGKRELAPASGSAANGTAWFTESIIEPSVVATRLLGTADGWIDRVGVGVSALVVSNVQ